MSDHEGRGDGEMRFRKSVNICKGVKLNLSKSGASVTVGPGKGVSLNLGTKGAYVNWSIPGTGVYDRVRVDTLIKDKLGDLFGAKEPQRENEKLETPPSAKMSPAAKGKGQARASAKSGGAKRPSAPSEKELERLEQEAALIHIHLLAPDVSPRAAGAFSAGEAERAIEDWLSEAEAPVALTVQTQALEGKAAVMIDLDLPEIEDMPTDKLTELADGTLKIKKKSQRECREDYKTCVFGLGEYVAGSVFALLPAASKAVVSAYTQRRDEKTGERYDAFIYSVIFEREAFQKGYQAGDPCAFCSGFESRFYILSSGVMKQIQPYEPEDV
ncbi:MAG: DUF4236 domain-containing protein [Clostridia bacterium]|nr:DUF4236 domain-containing protein [Clostridia bacterium]